MLVLKKIIMPDVDMEQGVRGGCSDRRAGKGSSWLPGAVWLRRGERFGWMCWLLPVGILTTLSGQVFNSQKTDSKAMDSPQMQCTPTAP